MITKVGKIKKVYTNSTYILYLFYVSNAETQVYLILPEYNTMFAILEIICNTQCTYVECQKSFFL